MDTIRRQGHCAGQLHFERPSQERKRRPRSEAATVGPRSRLVRLAKSFEKSFACRDRAARTQCARPMTRRPSSSRAQFLIASSSPTLSNPPELPNYSNTLSHSYTAQHGCLSARAGHRAIVKVRVDFSTVAACASLPTLSRSDRALLTPPRSIGVNPIQNHPLRTHTRSLTLPAHRSARSAATPWLVPCLQPRRMPGGGGDLNS